MMNIQKYTNAKKGKNQKHKKVQKYKGNQSRMNMNHQIDSGYTILDLDVTKSEIDHF